MGSSPAKRAYFGHILERAPSRCGYHPRPDTPPLDGPQGRLAQLVRASVLHTEGRRFDSVIAHTPPSSHRERAPGREAYPTWTGPPDPCGLLSPGRRLRLRGFIQLSAEASLPATRPSP